jgi:hypothetical protein
LKHWFLLSILKFNLLKPRWVLIDGFNRWWLLQVLFLLSLFLILKITLIDRTGKFNDLINTKNVEYTLN